MKCFLPLRAVTKVSQKDKIPAMTNQAQEIVLLIVKFKNKHITIAMIEQTFKIFNNKS